MQPVQLILIAIIVVIILMMVAALIVNQQEKQRRRMLNVIKGGHAAPENKVLSDREQQDKRRAEISKKLRQSHEGENSGKSDRVTLGLTLERAGLSITVAQFWLYSLVCMIVMAALAFLLGQSPVMIAMIAFISFLGMPRFVIRFLTRKRQKDFLTEFPDALEAMVRLLKAGMPVSEAISMISREYTGPVGEEMSRVYDKQKIGVPLHEAAIEATRRMPLTEMQMFATGLSIQAQTGSSLSEVLLNLAGVIRARFRLKRKIKALSSEAIASASIIGALPNLVALGMYFANRDYIMILFTDPFGKVLLVGSVIWMCIGIFMMKAMINFKV